MFEAPNVASHLSSDLDLVVVVAQKRIVVPFGVVGASARGYLVRCPKVLRHRPSPYLPRHPCPPTLAVYSSEPELRAVIAVAVASVESHQHLVRLEASVTQELVGVVMFGFAVAGLAVEPLKLPEPR